MGFQIREMELKDFMGVISLIKNDLGYDDISSDIYDRIMRIFQNESYATFVAEIDGNVIGPFIMGDYVGLSPFFIMLAIMVGGGLFGFPGMLLGVPVFALVYAMVKATTETRLRAQGLPTQSSAYEGAPENIPREIIQKEDEADEESDI